MHDTTSGNHPSIFTAIPYDGFDALLGNAATQTTTSTSSSSDARKEQLWRIVKWCGVVGVMAALGCAVGFSIAAIVRHVHHRRHHHHNNNLHLLQQQLLVEVPHVNDKGHEFWGTGHVSDILNLDETREHAHAHAHPPRRHSRVRGEHHHHDNHKDSHLQQQQDHNHKQYKPTRLFRHSKQLDAIQIQIQPHDAMSTQEEQEKGGDFFPLEEVVYGQDGFFPLEETDYDDYDDDYDDYDTDTEQEEDEYSSEQEQDEYSRERESAQDSGREEEHVEVE